MNLGKYASGQLAPPKQKKKNKIFKKIILFLAFKIINIKLKVNTWQNKTKQQGKKY